MNAPVLLVYEGEGRFAPHTAYWAKRCDEVFVVGQKHRLVEWQDRSTASHNQYFAAIANAWQNLPDHLLEHFQTPEMLRKKLLIRCGYADERSIACSSKAEAQRFAAFYRPADEYAIVIVRDALVTAYTAKSQSYRAMGKLEFERSKQAVLQAIDDLLGVEPGTTAKQTEAA
jgi:hypothetical protein